MSKMRILDRPWRGLLILALLVATMSFFVPSPALATDLDEPILICPQFPGEAPEAPRITAKGAVLMDAATGKVLYSRSADKRLEMASTTKIMTAMLILESMPLDQTVKVPRAAVGVAGSALGLRAGESFTVKQLLYATMVPSANDAAVTLAIAEAGSVKAFVAKMNAKAEELGLTKTHFANPSGLHAESHYSTAKDMATLASWAMKDPVFRRIVSTKEYTLPHAGGVAPRVIKTSNELMRDVSWVNGIKTGSTPYAGYCLVASATKNGLTLISVVLGAKNEQTRAAECKALLSYGFERCRMTKLIDKGEVVADAPAVDPLGRQVRLITESSFSRRVLGEDEVTGQVKLSGALTLPVEAGQVLGEIQFFQDDVGLGSVPLVAAGALEVATIRMVLDQLGTPWFQALPLARFLTPIA